MGDCKFFDLQKGTLNNRMDTLFPDWNAPEESVMILSPHDDDALLGTGYVIDLLVRQGVPVTVVIFCKGDAGYSDPALRESIVDIRKKETIAAYQILGLKASNIIFLDRPDFGLRRHVAWDGLDKENGLFGEMIRLFRKLGMTRLLVANGYREHSDHTAVNDVGMFDGIQSCDPILADFGPVSHLKSTHVYSVWADFSPEDALISGRSVELRANMGIAVDESVEKRIGQALRAYVSQGKIIDDLILRRKTKKSNKGYIELYQWIDPRPQLRYAPYVQWLDQL